MTGADIERAITGFEANKVTMAQLREHAGDVAIKVNAFKTWVHANPREAARLMRDYGPRITDALSVVEQKLAAIKRADAAITQGDQALRIYRQATYGYDTNLGFLFLVPLFEWAAANLIPILLVGGAATAYVYHGYVAKTQADSAAQIARTQSELAAKGYSPEAIAAVGKVGESLSDQVSSVASGVLKIAAVAGAAFLAWKVWGARHG